MMDERRSSIRAPRRTAGNFQVLLEQESRAALRGWQLGVGLVAHLLLLALIVVVPLLATETVRVSAPWQEVILAPPVQRGQPEAEAGFPERPLKLSDEALRPEVEAAGPLEAPRLDSSGPIGIPQGIEFGVLPSPGQVGQPLPLGYLRTGGRLKVPRLVNMVEPAYPVQVKLKRIEGNVELEVVLSAEGNIERIEVLRGRPELVEAAVAAVEKWKYEPAYLNERPVPVMMKIVVQFRLEPAPS